MARTRSTPQEHFVVDGSNIATEGRALPSLQQLNEAVLAFIAEHPHALITVVADATFGHRIDKREAKAFDEAVANNEIVTPPAGAVGRGDAFVLTIAHKAQAAILSNDSFQEFHGEYPWLFDAGRLIGGKPVPHVGWVFVERLPVRGPKSRMSVRNAASRTARPSRGSGSPLADQPLPVPTAPPPGPARAKKSAKSDAAAVAAVAAVTAPSRQAAPGATRNGAGKAVNEVLAFLDFVERHPVGTSCTVVVESYASHGAYARSGDVLVYLPLRLMGNPPPRSARSAVAIGDALAVVIAGYVPERRSVDAALPSAGDVALMHAEASGAAAGGPDGEAATAAEGVAKPSRSRRTSKRTTGAPSAEAGAAQAAAPETAAGRGRRRTAPSDQTASTARTARPSKAAKPATPDQQPGEQPAAVTPPGGGAARPPVKKAKPAKPAASRSAKRTASADAPAPAKRAAASDAPAPAKRAATRAKAAAPRQPAERAKPAAKRTASSPNASKSASGASARTSSARTRTTKADS